MLSRRTERSRLGAELSDGWFALLFVPGAEKEIRLVLRAEKKKFRSGGAGEWKTGMENGTQFVSPLRALATGRPE